MPFFRRSIDLEHAAVRAATPADIPAISRLLRDCRYHYVGYDSGDLEALLASAPGVVLVSRGELCGAVLAGWRADSSCWLRVLTLADGIPLAAGLDLLLPPFHQRLRLAGIARLFYGGEPSSDIWLLTPLETHGYVSHTEVVAYENHSLAIPSTGAADVALRRVTAPDLATVQAIDSASFTTEWHKELSTFNTALATAAWFVLAERDSVALGYAFATGHFAGRLVHLVRIAVRPAYQGQGIGVALLASVVEYARSHGAETLTLNTQRENLAAQRLYEWFGFERTGEFQPVLRRDLA